MTRSNHKHTYNKHKKYKSVVLTLKMGKCLEQNYKNSHILLHNLHSFKATMSKKINYDGGHQKILTTSVQVQYYIYSLEINSIT